MTKPIIRDIKSLQVNDIMNASNGIMVKVMYKSSKITFGQGRELFYFHVGDSSGMMKFLAKDRNCRRLFNIIKINQSYLFQHFIIDLCNKRFNDLNNELEFLATDFTILKILDFEVKSVPESVIFTDLAIIKTLEPNKIINVTATIQNVSEVKDIYSAKTKKIYKKKDVELIDNDNNIIILTLWNEKTELCIIPFNTYKIINVRIGQGNYMKSLNSIDRTNIVLDELIERNNQFNEVDKFEEIDESKLLEILENIESNNVENDTKIQNDAYTRDEEYEPPSKKLRSD